MFPEGCRFLLSGVSAVNTILEPPPLRGFIKPPLLEVVVDFFFGNPVLFDGSEVFSHALGDGTGFVTLLGRSSVIHLS